MPTTVRDPLVGAVVEQRYEVASKIASGGMATVYLATDARLGRPVALKVMHPHLASDPVFVERFAREARSAARLSHPGIVAVYDQGSDDGVVYLAMEHVPGTTLREMLAVRGALPVGRALDLLADLLDALASAHRADLVHRDVKPENILVGTDGRLRVADFGLARAASASTTAASVLIGTVAYLAPELVTAGRADARADVYAVGVLAFELLTGSLPFTGEVPAQVAFAHVADDVPAPSSRQAHLPPEVDELVAWATARDVDQRPRDAGELLAVVREVRAGLDEELAERAPTAPASASDGSTVALERHEHVLALPIGEALEAEVERSGPLPTVSAPTVAARRRTGAPAAALVNPTRVVPRPGTRPVRGTDPGARTPRGTTPRGTTQRGRSSRRARALLAVALLALAGAGVLLWAVLAGPLQRVSVPDVVTSAEAQAERTLEESDLTSTQQEEYSERAAPGTVLSTSPEAGERVRPGSSVLLVLSKGPKTEAVPDLSGQTVEAATETLEPLGLVIGQRTEAFSEDYPRGQIVDQRTPVGQQAREGAAIDVVVSEGREPIGVPDVRDLPQDQAEQRITDAGLVVGTVTRQRDPSVPEGSVIRTDPTAGNLFRGQSVALTVSDGPPTVTVPDLTGEQLDAARGQLESRGVEVEVDRVLGGIFGTVREQSVPPGTQVEVGSTVTLRVV